jgi:hypothetical protein
LNLLGKVTREASEAESGDEVAEVEERIERLGVCREKEAREGDV